MEDKNKWLIWEGQQLNEEQFAARINEIVKNHKVVSEHHPKWSEFIQWTDYNNQYSIWDSKTNKLQPVKLATRKHKAVVNLMKPLIEAIDSKINIYYKVTGIPNSSEIEDIKGAEVAAKLIEYNDYVNGIEDIFEEVKYDMLRTGVGCIKWYWDNSFPAKELISEGSEPRTTLGEVVGRHVPIFNIRQDPLAKSPSQLRWIVEIIPTTIEEIKDIYLKYGFVTEEEIESQAEEEAKAFPENEPPRHYIKIYIERRNYYYEKGRYLVFFGNKLIYASENKNPDTELGYFFFYFKKTPYDFWGISPLLYIQDIQREINRTISIISEHIAAWRPKMAVATGSIKRAGAFTIDNFEVLEVDFKSGEPRPINMPEVSPQVLAFRDFLIASIDRVSNVHEVSYARLPQYASRAPASLYAMMLEQENIKLDPMIKRANKTIIDMCRFRLRLMAKNYDNKRLIKIMGKGKKVAIEFFSKDDLKENFDIRLEIGVSLNQSPTIQQRLFIELWEKGIIEPTPKNRNKIMQLLNLGTAEESIRSDVIDVDKALRENQSFIDGKYLIDEKDIDRNRKEGGVIWLYDDDHEIHMEMHTALLKSEEAMNFDKETWQALINHIEQHRQAIIAKEHGAQPELMPAEAVPGQAPMPTGATMPTETPAAGSEPMIEGMLGAEPMAAAEFMEGA